MGYGSQAGFDSQGICPFLFTLRFYRVLGLLECGTVLISPVWGGGGNSFDSYCLIDIRNYEVTC